MAKILVSAAEYEALKKAAAQKALSPSTPPATSAAVESGVSVARKLEGFNQDAADKENEERREILEPDKAHAEEEENSAKDENQDSGGEKEVLTHDLTSFLPCNKQQEAICFLKKFVPHPAVEVERGVVFVRGRQIGHIVAILNHLFGSGANAIRDKAMFARFLAESGLHQVKKPKKKEEKKSRNVARYKEPEKKKKKSPVTHT